MTMEYEAQFLIELWIHKMHRLEKPNKQLGSKLCKMERWKATFPPIYSWELPCIR